MALVVLISNACKSSYGRFTYIFNQTAHCTDKTSHRVLCCSGNNIKMLHAPDGSVTSLQSGIYLEKQFHQSLKKAFNPKRQYQCQSIIFSFSNSEFDTSDIKNQSAQALQIVQGYVHKFFGEAQSVSAAQVDGVGGKLHVHLIINTVKTTGKTIPTSRFTVTKMRSDFNQYMNDNFERITGRQWHNPMEHHQERKDLNNLPTRSAWQQHLKRTIETIKTEVTTVKDFLSKLAKNGITVTERRNGQNWTYHGTIKTAHGPKKISVRDFYQRIDKKTGAVLRTRGLGKDYTKESLELYCKKQVQKAVHPKLSYHHHRKEVTNNDRIKKSEDREQLQKVKTLAAEARVSIEHRRELQQLTLQQLRAAEAEEKRQQQSVKREVGQTNLRQSNSRLNQSISEQARLRKCQEERLKAKQRATQQSRSKDDGPEL